MARHDNLGIHLSSAGERSIEVVEFKPQQHAVAVEFDSRIPDRAMLVFDISMVPLKDDTTTRNQAFVLWATMRPPAAQETLIPLTAGLNLV